MSLNLLPFLFNRRERCTPTAPGACSAWKTTSGRSGKEPHFVGQAKHIASAPLRVIAARWNPQLPSGPLATTGEAYPAPGGQQADDWWSLLGRRGPADSMVAYCGLFGPAAEWRQCALLARQNEVNRSRTSGSIVFLPFLRQASGYPQEYNFKDAISFVVSRPYKDDFLTIWHDYE